MRVPPPWDPDGSVVGSVAREIVLRHLLEFGVSVTLEPAGGPECYRLETEDEVIVELLPEILSGDQVKFLARRLNIPAHEFYARPRPDAE